MSCETNSMKIQMPVHSSVSPVIAYNKLSSKCVYDWIDRNNIDYTLFNNIIRDHKPSTQEFIEIYNYFPKMGSNEELPENVFRHVIKIINTKQNTYWGIGPFIKRGGRWEIMMRYDIRLRSIKPPLILFDACTQTDYSISNPKTS